MQSVANFRLTTGFLKIMAIPTHRVEKDLSPVASLARLRRQATAVPREVRPLPKRPLPFLPKTPTMENTEGTEPKR